MAESHEGPAKPSFSLSFLLWDHSFLGLPLSVCFFPSPASLSTDPFLCSLLWIHGPQMAASSFQVQGGQVI